MQIYFRSNIKKIGPSQFSIFRYVPPGPSFPLTYVVSIYHIIIQYKGFAGSRGGRYFNIKNGYDTILYFLTRNKFELKHASLMHMCNKT